MAVAIIIDNPKHHIEVVTKRETLPLIMEFIIAFAQVLGDDTFIEQKEVADRYVPTGLESTMGDVQTTL